MERYSIEVNEEVVEIYGDLTIEETFDFLSFFERKGYKSVVLGNENSTLRMMKKDQDQARENQLISDFKDEINIYKNLLKNEEELHVKTTEKLKDTEKLLKSLMSEEHEKYKKLHSENLELLKNKKLLDLNNDPDAKNILIKSGFLGPCPNSKTHWF